MTDDTSVSYGVRPGSAANPPSLCPVLPIGAEVLPGRITAQGSAVAEQPTCRRRALDCDLGRREDARHGGRAIPGFRMARCWVLRDGGSPLAWRQRGRPPGVGGAGSAAPPRERGRATADAPGAGSPPAFSPLRPSAWWCSPSQFALSLGHLRPSATGLRPGAGVPKARP
jgi:hypothetical protein